MLIYNEKILWADEMCRLGCYRLSRGSKNCADPPEWAEGTRWFSWPFWWPSGAPSCLPQCSWDSTQRGSRLGCSLWWSILWWKSLYCAFFTSTVVFMPQIRSSSKWAPRKFPQSPQWLWLLCPFCSSWNRWPAVQEQVVVSAPHCQPLHLVGGLTAPLDAPHHCGVIGKFDKGVARVDRNAEMYRGCTAWDSAHSPEGSLCWVWALWRCGGLLWSSVCIVTRSS